MAEKTLLFTTGAKGGVGKSFFMKALIDYIKSSGIPHLLFDCDETTQSIKNVYPDAELIPIANGAALDNMLQKAAEAEAPLILADMRAGSGDELIPLFRAVMEDAGDLLDAAGLKIMACALITNEPDTIFSLIQWAEGLGNFAQWLFVLNEYKGVVDILNTSNHGKLLKKECRPIEFTLPALEPERDASALRIHNATIQQILSGEVVIPELAGIAPKGRLRKYRRILFEKFNQLITELNIEK